MPFEGPQGQGPFEDHSDCVASMEDEEGITDADAICAVWEREAKADVNTKLRFDELNREKLLQCAVEHPSLVGDALGAIEHRAEAVNFSNVGGDPFDSEDVLRAFLNDLAAVADRVWLGDNEWPGPDVEEWPQQPDGDGFPIHDRPVVAEGVDLDEAAAIFERYEDDAVALGGPRPTNQDTAMKLVQRSATAYDVVGPQGSPPLQQRQGVDLDDPSPEVKQALEADDFIIYGKASIEQYDVEDTRISVQALEDALDRFFESEDAPGIISRGHTDVPVGMPEREHTLDSPAELVIDGQTYEFDAGDTLRTEVKETDGDGLPELWLVSRLANDSDISLETRAKALAGELNGYSVTVKPKAGAERYTDEGRDVLAVDLHAVTVGTDEQIKNKGSEFDVAEFKAALLARADDAAHGAAGAAEDLVLDIIPMSDSENESADSGEDQGFMARILPRSANDADEEQDTEQKAEADEDAMDDAEQSADPIDAALENGVISAADAGVFREVYQKNADAVATLLDAVGEGDMETDRAKQLASDLYGDGTTEAADDFDDDDDEEDEVDEQADTDADDVDAEQKQAIDEQEIVDRVMDVIPDDAGVTAADIVDALQGIEMDAETDKDAPGELKSALEAASASEERIDEIESKLDELAERTVTDEDLEQKLEAVGERLDDEFDDLLQRADRVSTPSPSAGETEGEETLADSVPTVGGD